jgi:undecaprenyl-diphosphatase
MGLAMRPGSILIIPGIILFVLGVILWFFHDQLEVPLAVLAHLDAAASAPRTILLVTRLGGAGVMIPFALGCVVLLLVRRRAEAAAWLFLTIATGRGLVEMLKHVIGRARPDASGHLVEVSSASFPSSHSAGAMLTVAALLMLLRPARPIAALFMLWPIMVGLSRMMLGVHWPGDVLAGWGLGLVWVGLAARMLPVDRAERRGTKRGDL